MKKTLILAAIAFAGLAHAQATPDVATNAETKRVTVAAKGVDVRTVLFDLFDQSKKSFVLEPNIRFVLFLSLRDVEFDEALAIILRTAELESEKQNGIYFISKRKAAPAPNPAPTSNPAPRPLGKLSPQDMARTVSTRLSMADIREVFRELGRQANVMIDVSPKVPNYKIDAFLNATSLRYALDVVTQAAGLKYTLTDQRTILIEPKK